MTHCEANFWPRNLQNNNNNFGEILSKFCFHQFLFKVNPLRGKQSSFSVIFDQLKRPKSPLFGVKLLLKI